MKILLLGAPGQVGHELFPLLSARGETIGLARPEIDLSDLGAVRAVLVRHRPQLIVNAAAYNEVDHAETDTGAAFRLNAEMVRVLAEYATREGAALVHYSTDFVFDGEKGSPYVETDPVNPLSAYGRSKLAAEQVLEDLRAPSIVLRTSWVYSLRRRSFVSMILRLAREREELSLVTDHVGSPTYCRDLAVATVAVVDALGSDPGARALEMRGVYHAAGGGACSRADLAVAALALDPKRSEHRVRRVVRVTSEAFPTPARRPRASPLACDSLEKRFGVTLPPWQDALERALTEG